MPTELIAGRPAATAAPGRPAETGFSIVELMIGTVLMVVGLVGIMSSCIRLHGLQRMDTEIGHAFRACRSNLEELRSKPISALAALNGTGFNVPGSDGVTPLLRALPNDPDGLPGQLQVTLDRNDAGRLLYRIRAVVTWRSASATDRHSVDLSTLRGGKP